MIRYIKALGLVAFAALAMSATFASAASAQEATLTAGDTVGPTHQAADITGEQYPHPQTSEAAEEEWTEWNFFSATPEAGEEEKVRCDTAILSGTTETGTATNIKVQPEYIHCSAGSQPATVNMNGCEYLLTDPITIEPFNTGRYTGKVDLTCPEGAAIEINAYLFGNSTNTSHSFKVCTIKVTPNGETVEGHVIDELGGHVVYQNIADNPDDITAVVTAEGITVDDGCISGEEHNNGVYSSTLTVKAFEHEGEHKENEQLDLWLSHN